MKKLLLIGTMLMWGAAAHAENGSGDCPSAALPVVQQTDVSTVERTDDGNGAVIQLDVDASLPDGRSLNYVFSSNDGSITSDGSRATWTVSGAGPFTADVEVSGSGSGCRSHAHFTYHMEQGASQ